MIYHSAEARWFLRTRVDAPIDAWIRSGGLAADREERTDAYIVLPGCRTAGVKFREGNFEVKAATSVVRDFAVGDTIAGRRGTWVKWSRPSNDTADLAGAMRVDEQWAFVRKRRVMRRFSLAAGSVAEVAQGSRWLAAGCQVERTIVSVIVRSGQQGPPRDEDWRDSDTWWTVGFEAFGETTRIEDYLDRMLGFFAAEAPAVSLPLNASLSYPAWLAELATP